MKPGGSAGRYDREDRRMANVVDKTGDYVYIVLRKVLSGVLFLFSYHWSGWDAC